MENHPQKSRGKKPKCTKVREHGRLLVFGKGINMAQTTDTESTLVVGRVRGRNYSTARLKRRIVETWGHILEQFPVVLTMTGEFFAPIFAHLD